MSGNRSGSTFRQLTASQSAGHIPHATHADAYVEGTAAFIDRHESA